MPLTSPASPAGVRSRSSAVGRVLPLVPSLDRPPPKGRPLPDATAVRLIAVPESAPPFDDERTAAGQDVQRVPGRLALVTGPRALGPGVGTPAARPGQPPPASPLAPGQPPAGRPAPAGRLPAGRPTPGPARQAPAPGTGWPGQFAQVLAETLAGSRPPGQIVPWTTDQARRRIRQLGPTLAVGVQPRVRRVVTFRPAEDVVEMTVVVGFGPRIRALAVRLERDAPRRPAPGRPAKAARWVCTAIEAA